MIMLASDDNQTATADADEAVAPPLENIAASGLPVVQLNNNSVGVVLQAAAIDAALGKGDEDAAQQPEPAINNLGISSAALLAPVPPPPKKKRKSQAEFTISAKLAILDELDTPNPPSVPDLAAKYNTSRTSIYRWKSDLPRLKKLAAAHGKGGFKRVSSSNEKQKSQKQRSAKTRYNEEFTAAEKLAVVRELKQDNAPSVRAMAKKWGANHRSVYRWMRDEERLTKLVDQDGMGARRRMSGDPILRIKEALKVFHAHHVRTAAGQDRQLTGPVVAAKALQIRDDMLVQHAVTPFLTEEEVKGMKAFHASTSWGRQLIVKYGWRESVDESSSQDGQAGATPRNSATKRKTSTSPSARNKKKGRGMSTNEKLRNLRAEVSYLKELLEDTDSRANALEVENAQLKGRISELLAETATGAVGVSVGDDLGGDNAVGGSGDIGPDPGLIFAQEHAHEQGDVIEC